MPGEKVIASAYGIYSKELSLSTISALPGYFALTSMDRILFHNNINSSYTDDYIELQDVTKIKLKRGILGNLIIKIEYKYSMTLFKRNLNMAGKLKFNTPKVIRDGKFKKHKENVDKLETVLNRSALL